MLGGNMKTPIHMLIITSSLDHVFVFVYAWRELLVDLNV